MERRGAIIWAGSLALTTLVVCAAPVEAFYWYGTPPKTIVPPPPEPPEPPPPPPPPPPITVTPEPSAVVGALVGLGVVAARRAARGRRG
jgi:protein TonB